MRVLILALALTACVPQAPLVISAPASYADRTAVDEQVAVGIENAYKLLRTAMELGVDAGLIKGAFAMRVAEADRVAYNAILVEREAYKTGNSADFLAS
ncbi:MAG: hypothetical protein M3R04_02350, partial [bacterium]|nr:hypothetical protein [bacterium]